MSFDSVLTWFEEHPDAKPGDLADDIALIMRLGRTGELALPADFLVRFYCLHLKKINKPLPKGPADYDMKFVDKADEFFSYVGDRCLFNYLRREDMVTYQDPDVPLLASDLSTQLKSEYTEKGKKAFEDFRQKIAEARQKQEKTGKAVNSCPKLMR